MRSADSFSTAGMLVCLLLGQVGFGPGLIGILTGSVDGLCQRSCASADEGCADSDEDPDGCPDEGPGEPCDCDCSCGPTALVAVSVSVAPRSRLQVTTSRCGAPEEPESAAVDRIFRPPRRVPTVSRHPSV